MRCCKGVIDGWKQEGFHDQIKMVDTGRETAFRAPKVPACVKSRTGGGGAGVENRQLLQLVLNLFLSPAGLGQVSGVGESPFLPLGHGDNKNQPALWSYWEG